MNPARSTLLALAALAGALGASCSKTAQGANNGRGVATYPDGSWVVTGRFEAEKAFGRCQTDSGDDDMGDDADESTLRSKGNTDLFLARYRADGGLDWVVRAGGLRADCGEDVAALPDGGCLVTGQFSAQARFGTVDEHGVTLSSTGSNDAFLARFHADGTLAWARRCGGSGSDCGRGVAVFDDGSIAVVGRFEATATFPPAGGGELHLGSAGKRDAFVARFGPDGRSLWVRRLGGPGLDNAEDVAALADGSCVVAGSFQAQATFGDDPEPVLTSAGEGDAFVLRIDAGGALAWARSAGGPEDDNARGVATFADGSSAVTGRFGDVARFAGAAAETLLRDAGRRDIFVARYDSAGSLLWARRAGGVESDYGRGVAAGADGSCTVTGYFRDTAHFGDGEPGAMQLTSSGGLDLFVARWGKDGDLRWARSAGSVGPERGYGVACLPDGAAIVAGGQPLDGKPGADDLLVTRFDAAGGTRR